jgi:hypothetical protein
MKNQHVLGMKTDYSDNMSFWIFKHDDGNHTIEFEGKGHRSGIQGLGESDCIRIAAAIMRLFGGDVYDYREDEESELGHE